MGVAKKKPNGHIYGEVRALGFHVLDSFDFEGQNQLLGFWTYPDVVTPVPIGSESYGIFNASYKAYRAAKRVGGDFISISDQMIVPLNTPLPFHFTP